MLSAGEAHETRALYGSARHCCGPARGFDGPDHGPAHMFFVIKVKAYALTCFFFIFFFVFFPLLDSVAPPMSRTHAIYPHNPATTTARSDGFRQDWWTTTSFDTRSSSSRSSSICSAAATPAACFCNTGNTCCYQNCHSKGAIITPVIAWQRLPMPQRQSSFPARQRHTNVNVAATFGQNMSPVWANLTKFYPAVPSGLSQART